MTPAKFLSPVLVDRDGLAYALDGAHSFTLLLPRQRDARFAERGQRPVGGVWPDGGGVVELEDIPDPVAEVAAELRASARDPLHAVVGDRVMLDRYRVIAWADRLDGAR